MKDTTILIIVILVILAILGIIHFTGEANILGFQIKIPSLINEEPIPKNNITMINPSNNLKIDIKYLDSRQKIYSPDDIAYIDFEIINTLKIPYNITVNWFFNNTRYNGWSNTSTEIYNVNQEDNTFWSSYPVLYKGEWEVQLMINYQINNQTFRKEAVTNFKVI